jgi:hypothetical protein
MQLPRPNAGTQAVRCSRPPDHNPRKAVAYARSLGFRVEDADTVGDDVGLGVRLADRVDGGVRVMERDVDSEGVGVCGWRCTPREDKIERRDAFEKRKRCIR